MLAKEAVQGILEPVIPDEGTRGKCGLRDAALAPQQLGGKSAQGEA